MYLDMADLKQHPNIIILYLGKAQASNRDSYINFACISQFLFY